MHTQSLAKLIKNLQDKKISSTELVTHYLQRIAKYKNLNAFISIDEEYALKKARAADAALLKGNALILTGIPMAHKDIFCTKHLPTTCASKMLENFASPYDATIVQRLNNQGSIMVGKTNMDEFGMGSTGENSYFGLTKNPWNRNHVTGGSSSGSVSAVAARIIPFATTTDTGGSTRQPAAFCGLSGIKPTYGLVSRFGQIAYASSFDQAGIVTTSVEDLAITTQVIAGFDKNDSTSVDRKVDDYTKNINNDLRGLRIGFPTCLFSLEMDDEIYQSLLKSVQIYKELGAEIIEIKLDLMHNWLPCYHTLANAEASSNLQRYDGIEFGYRAHNQKNIIDLISNSRSEGFGDEVKKRILTGTYILSSGNIDDYYINAQKVRKLISNEFNEKLAKVDVILGPTTPSCAFEIGEHKKNLLKHKLADTFTVPANLAGLPALALPSGFAKNGLPIGMQLIGNYFSEKLLFQIGHAYQMVTDWHKKSPDLGDVE